MLPAVVTANERHEEREKGCKLKPKTNKWTNEKFLRNSQGNERKGDEERVRFLLMNISVFKKQRKQCWLKRETPHQS